MKNKPLHIANIRHVEPDHLYSSLDPLVPRCFGPERVEMTFEIHGPTILRYDKDTLTDTMRRILSQVEGLLPRVTKVIFNGPATIVFWDDGEKTVVKCSECGDGRCLKAKGYERDPEEPAFARPFFCEVHSDPEKALMAAILKRVYHGYQDVLREFVPEADDE